MNTALQTFQFDGIPVSVVDQDGEGWMISEDIGKALDYSTPRESINKIFERYQEDLEEYSDMVKLTSTDGKKYDMRVFNEEGVMMIGFFSKQPKAVAFRKWAVKILKTFRHNALPEQNTETLLTHTLQKMVDTQSQSIDLCQKLLELKDTQIKTLTKKYVAWGYKHEPDEIKAVARCRAEGYTYADIAELLGRSHDAVKHMMRKSKGLLV